MKKKNYILITLIILISILTVIGISVSENKYNSISITKRFKAPDGSFLFGTDAYGRNLFYRSARAIYNTLFYSIIACAISIILGFVFGLISGYFGGFVDFIIQTLIDVTMSFPSFFLVLTIIAAMPQNGWNVIIAIVISSWANIARIIRSEIMSIKNREFILASRCLGASFTRIIFWHILPNCINTLIVTAIFSFGTAVLTESSLSFLKLGIKDDIPTLGNLIAGGRDVLRSWWVSFFPGILLFTLIFTINLIGETLREKLDPKL